MEKLLVNDNDERTVWENDGLTAITQQYKANQKKGYAIIHVPTKLFFPDEMNTKTLKHAKVFLDLIRKLPWYKDMASFKGRVTNADYSKSIIEIISNGQKIIKTIKDSDVKKPYLIGIDQYGCIHRLGKEPSKYLKERFSTHNIAKMYVDIEGKTYHCGYIVKGLWIEFYKNHLIPAFETNKQKCIKAIKKLIRKQKRGEWLCDHGHCPLCQIFFKTINSEEACKGCPVASASGRMGCGKYGSYHKRDYDENTKTFRSEARAKFWKKNLPEIESWEEERFTPEGWKYQQLEDEYGMRYKP